MNDECDPSKPGPTCTASLAVVMTGEGSDVGFIDWWFLDYPPLQRKSLEEARCIARGTCWITAADQPRCTASEAP